MALRYKTRKRLALLALLVWLPAYVVAAVTLVGMFDRPPLVLEFAIYVGLGILWALPLRPIFLGIGKEDPDAEDAGPDERRGAGRDRRDG